ncbi:MAG: EAL domain-containing protein [Parvibaculaceae bacterium]|nr:EAL domain-containing protein [Parvibaculaceae bacterium]
MDKLGSYLTGTDQQHYQVLADGTVLDASQQVGFDRVVRIAAEVFNASVTMLMFVNGEKHWCQAACGISVEEISAIADSSRFCLHTLAQDGAYVVEDASSDPRYAQDALVRDEPYVRFYAGVPLRTAEGIVLGVLCVFDRAPHMPGQAKLMALQDLAQGMVAEMVRQRPDRPVEGEPAADDPEPVRREDYARLIDYIDTAADICWETDEHFRFRRAEPWSGRNGPESGSLLALVQAFAGSSLATGQLWQPYLGHLQAHEAFRNFSFPLETGTGEAEWFEASGKPYYLPAGSFGGYRGTTRNITARVKAERRTRKLAQTDALTGLPNRHAFLYHLDEMLKLDRLSGALLILIDIDHFKKVNDTLGHHVGDQLLVRVADRLREELDGKGYLARIGGDEFVVLVDPSTLSLSLHQLAMSLLGRLSEVLEIEGRRLYICATIGISQLSGESADPGERLKMADLALFHAKLENRGSYRIFEPRMLVELQESEALRQEIHGGLKNGDFEVFYQPIFNISRQMPATVEALIRWRHPVRGVLAPSEFLEVSEQAGLMPELTRLVICEAALALAAWRREGRAIERVAINLSPSIFIGSSVIDYISEATREAGISPHDLEIEVTETLFLSDSVEVDKTMSRLRAMGVSIALDDFGTGYSSLVHLRRVKVDRLKIDRSFVRGMLENNVDAIIVRAVVELARSLGIEVVAEGVETQAQFDALGALGCHCAQGYLLARPMPADQIGTYLDEA